MKIGVVFAEPCQLRHVSGMAKGVRFPEDIRFPAKMLLAPVGGILHMAGDGLAIGHIQIPFNPGAGRIDPAAGVNMLLYAVEQIRVLLLDDLIEGDLTHAHGKIRAIRHEIKRGFGVPAETVDGVFPCPLPIHVNVVMGNQMHGQGFGSG